MVTFLVTLALIQRIVTLECSVIASEFSSLLGCLGCETICIFKFPSDTINSLREETTANTAGYVVSLQQMFL